MPHERLGEHKTHAQRFGPWTSRSLSRLCRIFHCGNTGTSERGVDRSFLNLSIMQVQCPEGRKLKWGRSARGRMSIIHSALCGREYRLAEAGRQILRDQRVAQDKIQRFPRSRHGLPPGPGGLLRASEGIGFLSRSGATSAEVEG